jgi:hypothetical protein
MLFPLLVAITLVAGIGRTSIAQNPGDPVAVQFGSYLSPTAYRGNAPYLNSYNCYSWTSPPYQACHIDSREYSSALFAAVLSEGQAIQITSFNFFLAVGTLSGSLKIPNIYDVYMGVAGGSLSLFGTFGGGLATCGPMCVPSTCSYTPSETCVPETNVGVGSYLYDPSLGNLQIKMVEIADVAVGYGGPYWYDNGEMVTRFDGAVVATPEPATIVLVGSGFVTMLGFARRRRRDSR